MKQKECWKKILKKLDIGKTFLTLHNDDNFSANTYYNLILVIPHSTRKIRYIKNDEFSRVWKHGLTLDLKERLHPGKYGKIDGKSTVNASYIITLIDFYLRKFKTEWE